MKRRTFNSPLDFFHNNEHGGSHCHSDGNFPYRITMQGGKHKISAPVAVGHGKGNKPVKFKFTERLGDGYNLASGRPVGDPEIVNKRVGPRLQIRGKK